MPVTKVIRYRTKPDRAEENDRLIREVFAELAEGNPRACTTRRSASMTV